MLLCPTHTGSYRFSGGPPLSRYPEPYLFVGNRQGYSSPLTGDRITKGNQPPFTMTDFSWCINMPAPSTLSSVTHLQCVTPFQYVLLYFPQLLNRIKFQLNFRGNWFNNVPLIMCPFPVLLLHSATVFLLLMLC